MLTRRVQGRMTLLVPPQAYPCFFSSLIHRVFLWVFAPVFQVFYRKVGKCQVGIFVGVTKRLLRRRGGGESRSARPLIANRPPGANFAPYKTKARYSNFFQSFTLRVSPIIWLSLPIVTHTKNLGITYTPVTPYQPPQMPLKLRINYQRPSRTLLSLLLY